MLLSATINLAVVYKMFAAILFPTLVASVWYLLYFVLVLRAAKRVSLLREFVLLETCSSCINQQNSRHQNGGSCTDLFVRGKYAIASSNTFRILSSQLEKLSLER